MNGTLTAKKTGKCSATGLKIEPGDEVIRFGKGYALADQITVGEVEPTFVYINDPPLDAQSELRRIETLWRRRNEARAMRVEKKRMIVDHWRAGSFRVIAKPCKCGRDHLALECRSAMGIEEVCPVTWWTWLAMLARDPDAFIGRFPIENVLVPVSSGEMGAVMKRLFELAPNLASRLCGVQVKKEGGCSEQGNAEER